MGTHPAEKLRVESGGKPVDDSFPQPKHKDIVQLSRELACILLTSQNNLVYIQLVKIQAVSYDLCTCLCCISIKSLKKKPLTLK